MGVARQHGGKEALTRGMTAHQNKSHKFLLSQGWDFYRQSGKTANVYRHPDGRTVIVNATPTSPSNEFNHLRQKITIREEHEVPTTTPKVKPTTPLVAMADPFLLKEATTTRERAARNHALAGWVKRVLEKHGPLPATTLEAAAVELGFARHHVTAARSKAGASAWRAGGKRSGWMVGLSHQLPEDRTAYGRESEPESGIQHVQGDNNGAGPEPREEPATAKIPGWNTPEARSIHDHEPLSGALSPSGEEALVSAPPDPAQLDGPLPPAPLGADIPFKGDGGEVSAAAQLLLSSLGLKTLDPDVIDKIRQAEIRARRSKEDAGITHALIEQALRMVTG